MNYGNYHLTEDGTRVYLTDAEVAEEDVLRSRLQRMEHRHNQEERALADDFAALRTRVLARAAAEAKAEGGEA